MSSRYTLLIIGGTGFIGKHLVKSALTRGYTTTVISLNEVDNNQRINKVTYITVDISNLSNLKTAMKGLLFTHVINLGGYINHARYQEGGRDVFDAHFVGVQNLVTLLDWTKLKSFVQIGSSDEYGDAHAPQSESLVVNPISPYSAGKAAATILLQMLYRTENFPAVIIRLFLVYGPGQNDQRFLPQIIKGCLQGSSFSTSEGQQLRDFCYIDDVIEGIFLTLESSNANGEIINIASGEGVKIRTVIDEVVKIVGKGTPNYGQVPYRNGENMALYADISKSKKILDWKPEVSLEKGLEKTIDSYK